MRLLRLLYLLAQHPLHLHRALVRRGLALQWIDDFIPFWNQVRPPSLPITDYASFTWLEYFFTQRAREKYPQGDHFDDMDWQYARLLSYVKRREMHPLRMLKVAWHLRHCKAVLEFGAGAAPYAHFIKTAWPFEQFVWTYDLPGMLEQYQQSFNPTALPGNPLTLQYPAIVCTEVFEHLETPAQTAAQMIQAAPLICFDYVDSHESVGATWRQITLEMFRSHGTLTGPDPRGLYKWVRR